MDPNADPEDVAQVLRGDRARFAGIVRRHEAPVRAVLRGHLGPDPEVDDLAQDVFLRAWRALASWRPRRGSLRTWLLAIARHRARDHLRRCARRPRPAPLAVDPPAPPAAPDGDRARLDAALADLPAERRVVFLLADVHGLPLAEIAAIEEVPLGTVKSRLDRARRALRAAVHPEEEPR